MKKTILFLAVFFLIINFSQAATTDQLIAYYKFNESTPIRDSTGTQVDAVNAGADYVASGGAFDGYFNFTSTDKMNLSGNFKSTYTSLAFGGFFKSNAVATGDTFGYDGHNGANQGFFLRFGVLNKVDCVLGGGGSEASAPTTYNINAWEHYVCNWNGTHIQIYKNGNLINSTAKSVYLANSGSVCLGSYCTANLNYNGGIDEPFFYNRSLTLTEIQALNSSQYPFGEETLTPSLTLNTNIISYGNYSSIPLVIYFNGTPQYTSDAGYNCTLTENLAAYAYNATKTNLNLSVNQNFTINTSDTSTFDGFGLWTANVSCSNINATGSFKRDNLFIDVLSPSLNLLSMANNTILYRHIDPTINATVRATDLNLYAMNVTIYKLNSSGVRDIKLFSQFNDSLGTTYTIQYLNNYTDNTTITNGKYEIEQMAWDSHTDNVVRNMSLYYQDNLIQIDDIKFESASLKTYNNKNELISYFYLTTDRHKVKMTFDQASLIHKINLSTTGKLSYLPDSEYKGHFVYFPYHWIDFMGSNVDYVESKYIADNKYEITIHLKVASDEVELESIGDLNTVKQSSYFNITDGFTFYAREHYSQGVISAFNVFVYNGSTLIQNKSTLTGNLTFNITSGVYYTNITATGYTTNSSGNLTFLVNGSFVYDLFLTNSLLLFYYDEDTFLPLTGTNVTIDVINLDNASSTNSSTYGYAFISGFAPGRYELQFKAPGYMPNSYFVTINTGTTQQIKLYLVSNTTGAYIIFNLADEKGNPIKNATLIRKRFDLTQNAYVTTGMAKSDANGETSMNLVPYNVYYRFVVQAGEIVLFSGTEQKVLAGTVYFRVPILKDILTSYALRYDGDLVTSPIDWNNATNIVSFTWTDTSGKVLSGCLRVLERTPMVETTKGTSCASSSSGTVTINMSGQINNKSLYIAQGYIDTNSTYTEMVVETLFRSFSTDYAIGGLFGLFMAYILIITMWFLGIRISFSIASLFAVLSVIMINLSGLSFFGYGLIVFFGFMGIMIGIIIKN